MKIQYAECKTAHIVYVILHRGEKKKKTREGNEAFQWLELPAFLPIFLYLFFSRSKFSPNMIVSPPSQIHMLKS